MRRFFVFFNLCFISSLFSTNNLFAQNIGALLKELKENLGEVTIDKSTYTQSIQVLDEAKGKIIYKSVVVNEKKDSASTAYEFYISDIDKNTLIHKPSGKKIFVSFWLNNKQKFIKYYKNAELESYTDNIEILVIDSDVAQKVIGILKSSIPLAKTTEKSWTSTTEALKWLQANIGEVKAKTGTRTQTFSFNSEKSSLVEFNSKTTDSKGTAVEEKYNWNLTDLNKNKLSVKISGTAVAVELVTKNSDKFIRFLKNGELQNYVSEIEIASGDIDHARNVLSAFSFAAEKSKAQLPEFKSPVAALDFIKATIGKDAADQKDIKQKFDYTNDKIIKCNLSTEETDSKGKNIISLYEFYLPDIDPQVVFKVSGKKIIIPITIPDKKKFIRYTKDAALQNYIEDINIYLEDIETAREVAAAFNFAAKGSPETPVKFSSIPEALKFIQDNTESTTIGTDQYKLSFEANTTEPYGSKYSVAKTDAKAITTEDAFLIYPYLLDPKSVTLDTEGKFLTVNAVTSGKKALIKKSRKEVTSFVSQLSLVCFDVKKAKDVAAALRYVAANAKQSIKQFSNKSEALDYISKSIKEVSTGGKTIKQAVEFASDNPCKISLNRTTNDDKGKSTEEIFEFTLLDMNKELVDYKASGTSIVLTLTCKGKQKLIKTYKDGTQQSFAADVDIFITDADDAKNITDALRYAIGVCE